MSLIVQSFGASDETHLVSGRSYLEIRRIYCNTRRFLSLVPSLSLNEWILRGCLRLCRLVVCNVLRGVEDALKATFRVMSLVPVVKLAVSVF